MTGLVFHRDVHIYELDGEIVPSVTGILKASGLIDFSRIPRFVLDGALERGRKVHQAIHYFNERDLDVDRFGRDFPQYLPYLEAWINFCAQRRFVPVLNEWRVASRRHQLAGTIDCLGLLDGVPVLLDFATGRPEDVSKDLQTSAYYAMALEWAMGDAQLATFINKTGGVVKRYAVALRKNGTFAVEGYADPTDFRKFMTLRDAQRIVAARRGEYSLTTEAA